MRFQRMTSIKSMSVSIMSGGRYLDRVPTLKEVPLLCAYLSRKY